MSLIDLWYFQSPCIIFLFCHFRMKYTSFEDIPIKCSKNFLRKLCKYFKYSNGGLRAGLHNVIASRWPRKRLRILEIRRVVALSWTEFHFRPCHKTTCPFTCVIHFRFVSARNFCNVNRLEDGSRCRMGRLRNAFSHENSTEEICFAQAFSTETFLNAGGRIFRHECPLLFVRV